MVGWVGGWMDVWGVSSSVDGWVGGQWANHIILSTTMAGHDQQTSCTCTARPPSSSTTR